MVADASFGEVEAARLLRRVIAGETRVFMDLVRVLWPEVQSLLARSRRLVGSHSVEDDRNEIAVNLMEKFQRDDFRALRQYEDWQLRHPEKSLSDWLRIVLANASRDFLRAKRGATREPTHPPSPLRVLNEFAATEALDQLGYRPPITASQTARQLLEFAARALDPLQLEALSSWLQGADFDELARSLELGDADAARKLVRAAVATLRRKFADRAQAPPLGET